MQSHSQQRTHTQRNQQNVAPINCELRTIRGDMAQKDDAATQPAVIHDHVDKCDRPDNNSILENAQQPGNQYEVDRP